MNPTLPTISIIIPVLNEEKYLPSLLTDLSRQVYRDFEVVIVDGHSDDDTVAKAEHFAHRLPKLTITNSEIRDVCYQRNLGAKHTVAETILFMDADNRLEPHFLLGLMYRHKQTDTDFFSTWVKSNENDLTAQAIDTVINLYLEINQGSKSPFGVESMFGANRAKFLKLRGFGHAPAEGAELLRRAVSKKMTFAVFKDPTYAYSMRRLRKQGTLGTLGRIAQIEIYRLLDLKLPPKKANHLYPMKGGNYYEEERLRQSFFDNLLNKIKLQKQKERLINLAKKFLSTEF